MKLLLFISLVAFGIVKSHAQSIDFEQLVMKYSKAGDEQNSETLSALTHETFRIIWHDGDKTELSNIPREVHLQKIRDREFGGDTRKATLLETIWFDDVNAALKITMEGEKATMKSLLSLVNFGGEWKIVQELVTAEFKGS